MSNILKLEARGEREIIISRTFNAPRRLVFDAFSKPELVRQWLLGPPGWSMPVCEIDFRIGGRYRYVWRRDSGEEMGMGGVYKEIIEPERIVATEKFDQSWYPGEGLGTILLIDQGARTRMTQSLMYESRDARDGVLKSPMESGVAISYDRLEALVTEQKS